MGPTLLELFPDSRIRICSARKVGGPAEPGERGGSAQGRAVQAGEAATRQAEGAAGELQREDQGRPRTEVVRGQEEVLERNGGDRG